jgi:hypothetical protein
LQTFLPYPDFAESAAVLDRMRLGKQRVETLQIAQALWGRKLMNTFALVPTGKQKFIGDEFSNVDDPKFWQSVTKRVDLPQTEWRIEHTSVGWANHPATKMWAGEGTALLDYQTAICGEWVSRGYKDTCLEKTEFLFLDVVNYMSMGFDGPAWLGREDVHSSHRANLLRKDPEWYGKYGWTEDPATEYVWPV